MFRPLQIIPTCCKFRRKQSISSPHCSSSNRYQLRPFAHPGYISVTDVHHLDPSHVQFPSVVCGSSPALCLVTRLDSPLDGKARIPTRSASSATTRGSSFSPTSGAPVIAASPPLLSRTGLTPRQHLPQRSSHRRRLHWSMHPDPGHRHDHRSIPSAFFFHVGQSSSLRSHAPSYHSQLVDLCLVVAGPAPSAVAPLPCPTLNAPRLLPIVECAAFIAKWSSKKP